MSESSLYVNLNENGKPGFSNRPRVPTPPRVSSFIRLSAVRLIIFFFSFAVKQTESNLVGFV